MGRYRRQSSAKRRTDEVTTLGRSFICCKNKRGPRTVPCGTPDITLAGLECLPSAPTDWVRVFKKEAVQSRRGTVHAIELQFP